jgi:hypothetical protein
VWLDPVPLGTKEECKFCSKIGFPLKIFRTTQAEKKLPTSIKEKELL